MNSKEALERLFDDLRQFEEHFVGCVCSDSKEEYDLIKKDLEILEIIKKHKLLNYVLKNEKCANMYHLSKEEIDLLREIEEWNYTN